MKMTVDIIGLIVRMKTGECNESLASGGELEIKYNGFMTARDAFAGNTLSGVENIFYAGAVTAPKNIGESMNEGSAVAMKVADYFRSRG